MKSSKLSHYINLFNLKRKLKHKKVFFFFPFYHVGGAERVHIDILKVFKDFQTVCIITNQSNNNYFYEEFKANTEIIELEKFKSKYSNRYIKSIIYQINKTPNSIVFGCNCGLFYNSIPDFMPHVKIIDLIHAFSYEEKNSSEKYSLPFVERINNRVVLGEKTYSDFKKLYIENNIDLKNLNKIKIIKNKVDVPDNFPIKPNNEILNVLFVGRNSYEKRPEIFIKIAQKCLDNNLLINFKIIGDFDKTFKTVKNVSIEGLVKEKKLLNLHYKNSDILLITSSREGFPMVILESMGLGVVPISTNVGEINEFINESNENGFLINNEQNENFLIENFYKKINELNTNRDLLKITQKKAYKTIKKQYTEEKFNTNYINLFTQKK